MVVEGVILDGRETAKQIRVEVKENITRMLSTGIIDTGPLIEGEEQKNNIRPPKLAVILVGDRKDSATYVSMKQKACLECGIESEVIQLSADVSELECIAKVDALAKDPTVDGILVQLPLPSHMNESTILTHVTPAKDVDGLLPETVGKLALKGHNCPFKPCTAAGCIEICKRNDISLAGKHVVVLGRSNVVGMPVALLFQQENATVTVCHSKSKDLPSICKLADVLVVAIGSPHIVKSSWLRDDNTAVIIDVGINPIPDETKKSKFRLVGDVDFDACRSCCSFITPVPGGVGPMTVAMLMKNTLEAWKLHVIP